MHVGILKQHFTRSGGGLERYTTGLVEGLTQGGHSVTVFASTWDEAGRALPARLVRVSGNRGPGFLRVLNYALRCRAAVRCAPCDLTFSLERTIEQDVVRAGSGVHREWLARRRPHLPWWRAATLAFNPIHPVLLGLERRTFSPRHTGTVIVNSHRGKAEVLRHFAFPAERVHVIHNGVDCERFRPQPRDRADGRVVLLFVGSGFERKGLAFAVRALARLPSHVHLHVAGRGRTGAYEAEARRLGVAGRLHFLGPGRRMEEVYAEGDVLIHPAIYEPFSNACLEALASGLPVVTSRVNGASEVLTPGRDGAVVENPADIEELAAAVRPFLDGVCRTAAAAAARATAERCPFSRNVEQTLAVLRQTHAKKQRARIQT